MNIPPEKRPPLTPGNNKPRATDTEIINMLIETRGNIGEAARRLGYKGNSLRAKICSNPKLRDAKNEIRENLLDQAEAKLEDHIFDKESLPALLEFLKAQGGTRGYGTKPIQMNLDAKLEHSADDSLLKSLMEKFENKLKEEAEDE